jgi:hypothetical protein
MLVAEGAVGEKAESRKQKAVKTSTGEIPP